jgi:hypothetical protein
VGAVFVDCHRFRDAGIHLCTATGDFGIPCVCSAGLGFRIEAADQFERKSGTLFGGKTEDFGEHIGGGHWLSLAASRKRRGSLSWLVVHYAPQECGMTDLWTRVRLWSQPSE